MSRLADIAKALMQHYYSVRYVCRRTTPHALL